MRDYSSRWAGMCRGGDGDSGSGSDSDYTGPAPGEMEANDNINDPRDVNMMGDAYQTGDQEWASSYGNPGAKAGGPSSFFGDTAGWFGDKRDAFMTDPVSSIGNFGLSALGMMAPASMALQGLAGLNSLSNLAGGPTFGGMLSSAASGVGRSPSMAGDPTFGPVEVSLMSDPLDGVYQSDPARMSSNAQAPAQESSFYNFRRYGT